MQGRTEIPESLIRNILMESSHRCAVCGTGCPFERAHIVPCDKSKPYTPENLICLCGSCHSKADNEKWDEPKLREHKKKPAILRYYGKALPPLRKVSKVQLIIDTEIELFDKLKPYLISCIASFLGITPLLVKILSVEPGTVKVTIEIPASKKKKILEAGLTEKDELPKYIYPLRILGICAPSKRVRTALQKKASGVTPYIDDISKNPIEKKIDFNTIESIDFKTSDIIQCEITGQVHSKHKFHGANIIRSNLTKITARQVNFNRIDFKDCFFKDSFFEESSFEGGALANSHFSDSTFKKCHYYNTSVTDSEFYNIIFEKCDLSKLMIKSCKFKECKFIDCKTSNKLFEMSLVLDCKFENTEIRIRTITDNFGLVKTDIISSRIRYMHIKQKKRFLNDRDIEKQIGTNEFTPLEKFKLSFFLNPYLVNGRDMLDDAFNINMWERLCKNPGTLANLLEFFSEFLLDLYEKNNLTVHTLLKFHTITGKLSNSDYFKDKTMTNTTLYKTILGVHMILARVVEEYLLVFKLLVQNISWPVIFLANGPLDSEFYTNTFSHIFAKSTLKIAKIQRRNSPNELYITGSNEHDLSVLLGNYLASRVKDELSRLKNKLIAKSQSAANMIEIKGGSQVVPYTMEIMKRDLEIPLLPTEISTRESFFYQLVLKSIMPGRLLEELRINETTSMIGKVRSTFWRLPAIEETGESF